MKEFTLLTLMMILVGAGMLSVLGLCPLHRMSWRFIRMIGVLVLALGSLSLSWYLYHEWQDRGWTSLLAGGSTLMMCIAAIGLVALSPNLEKDSLLAAGRLREICLGGCGLGLLAGLCWADFQGFLFGESWSSCWASGSSLILSSFLLGSVMVSWLLGHRYLTATEMTIDPLRRSSQLLIAALAGRGLFVLGVLVYAINTDSVHGRSAFVEQKEAAILSASERGTAVSEIVVVSDWQRMQMDWLMASVRLGVGLLLPGIFVYMAYDCVKLRSTQSATGILFFTSIFVVIGELTSLYLGARWLIPF